MNCEDLLEAVKEKYVMLNPDFQNVFGRLDKIHLRKGSTYQIEDMLHFRLSNVWSVSDVDGIYKFFYLIKSVKNPVIFKLTDAWLDKIAALWSAVKYAWLHPLLTIWLSGINDMGVMISDDKFQQIVEWLEEVGFDEWVILQFDRNKISSLWVKSLVNVIRKHWFKKGLCIDLSFNGMWFIWVKYISQAIAELWFVPWVRLWLEWNNMRFAWIKSLSAAIEKRWFEEWVGLALWMNWIWVRWIQFLARALEKQWFKKWVKIDLSFNPFWNAGAWYLLNAIKKVWLHEWVVINLSHTRISKTMMAQFNTEAERQWFDPIKVFIFTNFTSYK